MNTIVFLPKTSEDSTSSVRKFYLEKSLDMHGLRGESGNNIFWSQKLRSWKTWTRQKSMLGDSNFIFPIADGTVKLSGEDQAFRTSTNIRDQPQRSKERKDDLRGESDRSQPSDITTNDGEARNVFWSIEGNYIYRHHAEPRVQLDSMCVKKNHSQYHCNVLTSSREQILPWMYCWKAV